MANTANKPKAAATPRQASAKKEKAAEAVKPTISKRSKIELVVKAQTPKKAKAAAKLRKTAAKIDKVVAISKPKVVSREEIAELAYRYWVERGYQHGYAVQDWIRAEQALMGVAS